MAKGFQPIKTSTKTNYRELRMYNDFYTLDKQPKFIKEFYKNCDAFSFYISGDLNSIENDFTHFLRLLNFHMEYFDKESPKIILHKKETLKNEFSIPSLSENNTEFQKSINNPTIPNFFCVDFSF